MNFAILAKRASKIAADHSPTIFTTLGVVGTVATAFLTSKATLKATEILNEAENNGTLPFLKGGTIRAKVYDLTLKEKTEIVWKEYLPATGVGLLTIACLVVSHRIGIRRAAALTTAYNLAEKAAKQYADKVVETIGKKKELGIRDAIAQDEVDLHPIGKSYAVTTGNGSDLFRDAWSGRYFDSTRVHIDRAVNLINSKVNNEFYASLTDFYTALGLESTSESDNIGWNSVQQLEVYISYAATPDDKPCGVINFSTTPRPNYTSAF